MNIDLKKILAGVQPEQQKKRTYTPQRYELWYETNGMAPCVNEAHKAVQWWINDIANKQNDRRRWITLFGRSGCGKSHLMAAAKSHLEAYFTERERQKVGERYAEAYTPCTSQYIQLRPWASLFGELMKENGAGLMAYLQKIEVLMLDDIGSELIASERAQSASMKVLYELLDARLGKWTMITSNLAPEQIPDSRIASRLFRGNNIIIDMREAKDYSYEQYKRRHK